MYLDQDLVAYSVNPLSRIHPFFGITFLVAKKAGLPVGSMIPVPINSEEQAFLDIYYRPDINSEYYFQPFRSAGGNRWLSHKYPMSGSQSTRTRGQLARAFLHPLDTDLWGWAPNYVQVLADKLVRDKGGKVPAFWLAVWLFRNRRFGRKTEPSDLISLLIREFSISIEESENLFDLSAPTIPDLLLSAEPLSEPRLLAEFDPAPDASPDEGGTLLDLKLQDVGPARTLDFSPGERLSVITGDNGLGKTFLLECAWWSLTGNWTTRPATPFPDAKRPSIQFAIRGKAGVTRRQTVAFDLDRLKWPSTEDRPTIAGLIIYAKIDGSFAVWDPSRFEGEFERVHTAPSQLVFSRDEVLEGARNKIEGLFRDWVRWQNSRDQSTFNVFCRVLERLSAPDMKPLVPGEPTRVPGDSKDIPTIVHEYGIVPLTNESAGVKRIVTIAYLLVWAWTEHKVQSSLQNKLPQNNIVLMIDELESHLHPKWQRSILPALIDVTKGLAVEIKPQIIVATHSPLVLASIETTFDYDTDKLFHLYLTDHKTVFLEEIEYAKRGTSDGWLTSEIFELSEARSQDGEAALQAAKRLLHASSNDLTLISRVSDNLRTALPADDPFWPRWLHFATAKGAM